MIKINMGCGWRDFGSDWDHIDGGDYSHLDSKDICNLDYKDNSVDLIYSSHVLEYFDRDDVLTLLDEWYRVLKPKGTLRLAVPDFYNMVKLYYDGNGEYPIEEFLGPLYGKMDMGDNKIYHKTTYDEKSLSNVLSSVGFNNIRRYDWREYEEHRLNDDHSQAYKPNMDKENGTLISLNVECTK
jgi:predicted SAM-dependent methyltransferase|tara:strand:+ start:5636 stop:6184 length:549 start_codon:yes stop_codon:yes gene_type:complete